MFSWIQRLLHPVRELVSASCCSQWYFATILIVSEEESETCWLHK